MDSPSPQASSALPHDVLSVRTELIDLSTVVELDGPVCAFTAPHLDAELTQLGAAGRHRVVTDASKVRTLCTDGIDVLLDHERRCIDQGGDLVVRDARPSARRVLDILSLQRLLGPVVATPA
jgi:anti-anti-sigma factor